MFVVPPHAGHVNPTLPVVAELVGRGHRVSYASGPGALTKARDAGAEPVELPWGPPSEEATGEWNTGTMSVTLAAFMADARAAIPVLLNRFSAGKPDVVCYDPITFAGPILAARLDRPGAALIPTFAGNEKVSVQELLLPPDFDPAHPLLQRFGADLGVFAAEYGAGVDLFPASGTTAALNLVFMPQQFQIGGETFGAGYEFIGPSPEYREGTWVPRGRKILYVSQGTVYNRRPEFFELCVKAFGDSDWNVVMAVGDHVDLCATPDNFEVAPYVPQPTVLQNATAFLSQCGMGSVMDALYYEVPVIGVPHLPEQASILRRVEELGLGARLDIDGITPAQLRAEVEEVATDPVIRANLEIFSEHVRGAGGAARGADVLVKFAGQAK